MIAQRETANGEPLAATLERRRSAAFAALSRSAHSKFTKSSAARCKFYIEDGSAVLRAAADSSDTLDRQDYLLIGAVLANAVVTIESHGVDCELSLLPSGRGGALARLTPTVLAPLSEIESQMSAALAATGDREVHLAAWREDKQPSVQLLGRLRRACRDSGAWLDIIIDDARRTLLSDIVAQAIDRGNAEHSVRGIALGNGPGLRAPETHREQFQTALAALGANLDCSVPADELQVRRGISRSSLILVLGTDGDSPPEWMRTGIALQRTLLLATTAGLWANVYPEIREQPICRDALDALVFASGRPQVVVHFRPNTVPAA